MDTLAQLQAVDYILQNQLHIKRDHPNINLVLLNLHSRRNLYREMLKINKKLKLVAGGHSDL